MSIILSLGNKVASALRAPEKRSSKWPALRKLWLKDHPFCAACMSLKSVEAHHIVPFHEARSLELDPNNLITMCMHLTRDCHLHVAHAGSFKRKNPNVRTDADQALWLWRAKDKRGLKILVARIKLASLSP